MSGPRVSRRVRGGPLQEARSRPASPTRRGTHGCRGARSQRSPMGAAGGAGHPGGAPGGRRQWRVTSTPTRRARVRAPELRGRGWLNTGGRDARRSPTCAARSSCSTSGPSAASTACTSSTSCARWRRSTPTCWSIVGVHSPKFVHEADPDAAGRGRRALRGAPPGARRPRAGDLAAVRRPGLADAGGGRPRGLRRRAACPARATPTRSTRWSTSWSPSTRPRARCTAATGPYVAPPPPATELRFPGKAIALPGGTLLVADSGHHCAGRAGRRRRDGACGGSAPASAGWSTGRPATAPVQRAAGPVPAAGRGARPRSGYDVVVADTVNHALRGVRLGRRRGDARSPAPAGSGCRATGTDATSSLARGTWPGTTDRVVVAMAGIHQLWSFDPAHRRGRACWPARPTRGCSTARSPRRGSPRPPGLAARRRRPAVARRLRDLVAAATSQDGAVAHRRSARACSTSATSTGRPTRRCCSTRSA